MWTVRRLVLLWSLDQTPSARIVNRNRASIIPFSFIDSWNIIKLSHYLPTQTRYPISRYELSCLKCWVYHQLELEEGAVYRVMRYMVYDVMRWWSGWWWWWLGWGEECTQTGHLVTAWLLSQPAEITPGHVTGADNCSTYLTVPGSQPTTAGTFSTLSCWRKWPEMALGDPVIVAQ